LFRTRKILFRTRKKLGILNDFRFLELFGENAFCGIIDEFVDDPQKSLRGSFGDLRSPAGIRTGILNDIADPRGDPGLLAP